MKITISLLLFLVLVNPAVAQNELQKCAEKLNAAVNDFIVNNQGRDTAALKKLNELNKEWKECIIGKAMPDFNVQTITAQKINTAKTRGKVLVINFWYIACTPCIAEMPGLNQLVTEYKNKDVLFLGLTYQNKTDINNTFLSKFKFDFTIVSDAQLIEDSFGVTNHPAMFIIDKKGKVKSAWTGGSIGEKAKIEAYLKIKPIIDELLKEQ